MKNLLLLTLVALCFNVYSQVTSYSNISTHLVYFDGDTKHYTDGVNFRIGANKYSPIGDGKSINYGVSIGHNVFYNKSVGGKDMASTISATIGLSPIDAWFRPQIVYQYYFQYGMSTIGLNAETILYDGVFVDNLKFTLSIRYDRSINNISKRPEFANIRRYESLSFGLGFIYHIK